MVVAVSDPIDAFDLIQHALNYAEEFQMPVIVLTEKVIAETILSIDMFKQNKIPIIRELVEKKDLAKLKNSDRYKLSDTGISKRWMPGSAEAYYFANGDEHWESGELSEEAVQNEHMYKKRNLKLETLELKLPEPEVYGVGKGAHISFIGFGSTKNIMQDVIKEFALEGIKVNYLHYSYVYPLKIEKLNKFRKENTNIHLIEGNYQGQLGHYIEAKTDIVFKGKLLKYNGRAFYLEDLVEYINQNK
jgi:2-oxoglutarate ferredoxin oxidoreductase subunit alpha